VFGGCGGRRWVDGVLQSIDVVCKRFVTFKMIVHLVSTREAT
jgi:hypothetical protein